MLLIAQRSLACLCIAFLFGCATAASTTSDPGDQLSDARRMLQSGQSRAADAMIRETMPSIVSLQDDLSASEAYFLLAAARNDMNDSTEACAALSLSLHYYRKALEKDSDGAFIEEASDINDSSDGMAEVRSKFGCVSTQSGLLSAQQQGNLGLSAKR